MEVPEFPGLWDYDHDLTTIFKLLLHWKKNLLTKDRFDSEGKPIHHVQTTATKRLSK